MSQREKTLRGLESQIAGLAIDTAAKVIGEQAGSLDNAKLYDEFLNKAGDAHDQISINYAIVLYQLGVSRKISGTVRNCLKQQMRFMKALQVRL